MLYSTSTSPGLFSIRREGTDDDDDDDKYKYVIHSKIPGR